jgi:hypothetical protein
MSENNMLQSLLNMLVILKQVNTSSTDHVASVRKLTNTIDKTVSEVLSDNLTLTSQAVSNFQTQLDALLEGTDLDLEEQDITTTAEIEVFQLGESSSNVNFKFDSSSLDPPEHGTIIQKLWLVKFADNLTGHAIVSDTSDTDLCELFGAQLSTALSDAPSGAVEDLNVTISLDVLKEQVITNNSRDISSIITGLEKPGRTVRQLRDIDIDTDPSLQGLTEEQKTNIKNAVLDLNNAITLEDIEAKQVILQSRATEAGIFSTSLGPHPNFDYSDLKRFTLQKEDNTLVSVTMSMPIVSWGEPIPGIPLRDESKDKIKSNRKDNGTSYIVDMGGIDAVIRQGNPNPLPATRYFAGGPNYATETEGALDRYMGGKTVGINTTDTEVSIQTVLLESDGEVTLTLQPGTAAWKLDRATFDGSNSHAYYTVFAASRPPPAGFMGVVFAPKQNRLGRGRGEIASGQTLANGISQSGKQFMEQDENGAILDSGGLEVPANLKGLTSAYDGHAIHPVDLFKFMKDNAFTKGVQYLTIPANATLETVEDVLIPAGQFVPQVSQALATLMQFGNGKYISDGGPTRHQAGLIPFLPGTPAYTPEWHINFILYNIGNVECEGNYYPITDVAKDSSPDSWIRPNHNASFGPPGPSTSNSAESMFNPAHPETFDPIQLRCGIKLARNVDYINKVAGVKNGEITLSMLPQLEADNHIFFTEAPYGAMRGWVKFLVINCPLPVMVTINKVNTQNTTPDPTPSESESGLDESKCKSCSCERDATTLSVNGALNPIWLDEDLEGSDTVIGDRSLKFKVGDNIVIRSTTGTMHGVSLRFDDQQSNKTFDGSKTLAVAQSEVLVELKEKITINNEEDLENNFTALSADIIEFHGGIAVTFAQKATVNPASFPDGVVISDFTIKEGTGGSTGTVACTVHGVSMSFRFSICP